MTTTTSGFGGGTTTTTPKREIFQGRAAHSSRLGTHLLCDTMIVGAIVLVVFAVKAGHRHESGMAAVEYAFAALLAAAAIVGHLVAVVKVASIRYRITDTRIEIERGLLSKKIDNLELFRVKDLRFRQGLLQRMMGLGSIELDSSDVSDAGVETIEGLPGARALFDELRDAVDAARRARGVQAIERS